MCFEIEIVSSGLKVLVLSVLLKDALFELAQAYSKKKEPEVVVVVLDEDRGRATSEDCDEEDEIREVKGESKSD